jgi:hypothetical protein
MAVIVGVTDSGYNVAFVDGEPLHNESGNHVAFGVQPKHLRRFNQKDWNKYRTWRDDYNSRETDQIPSFSELVAKHSGAQPPVPGQAGPVRMSAPAGGAASAAEESAEAGASNDVEIDEESGQAVNVHGRAAGGKRKRNDGAGGKGKEAAGGKGKEAVVISSGDSSDSEEDEATDKRLEHSRAASAQESVRVIERLQSRVAELQQRASDARDNAIAAYGDAAKAHGRCSEEMDKTRRLQLSLNDAQRELARKKLDYDNECMRAAADYEKFAAEREQWEKREGELEQELHERSDTVQSLCIQAQTQNLDA